RGMLAGLSVLLGEWYAVAGPTLASWPLEWVTFTDVSGLTLRVDKPAAWRLTATLKVRARTIPLRPSALPSALGPGAHLVGQRAVWRVEEVLPDRAALVAAIAAASARLVDDLKDAAGDRGTEPPRSRR